MKGGIPRRTPCQLLPPNTMQDFTIYRAVRTKWLSQGFGENKVSYYKDKGLKGHTGYDWVTLKDEKIYWEASVSGKVLYVGYNDIGGHFVMVITETSAIYRHYFGHLESVACKAGQMLDSGELIGVADNTGISTGNHCHRDLAEMLKDNLGNYSKKYPNNGYAGREPIQKFHNEFVVDAMRDLKLQAKSLKGVVMHTQKSLIKLLLEKIETLKQKLKVLLSIKR